ncbi:TetR family transcriptional regulator [Corynebacterium sp. HMSC056E09]|nr:TetR/AcrR family transcriptional regulator [Corynebacterium sp. HMSC056E09]OFK92207.1 TetR family transcriptional regulator [Corynebacterium sp. HMSC068H04]OFL59783.1 TetR family transcriptional regulator [Corynebacterium sp. HMSC065D07]OFQ95026.1 TetR family transcriptional regulator [Corynebacterium sp. HMSC056E09]PKZ24869.1 TetR family transcriptional regulator [Corynebacterium aurimucosum]
MQEEMSLREQKRLKTRLRIEDAATRLVDERGFADVTVEEICDAAGISRRTFFNYFDSKDTAVLGAPSHDFTEEQKKAFLSAPTDSVFRLAVDLIKGHLVGQHVNEVITERRRRISGDSDAAAAALSRKRAKSNEILELITERLDQDASLRQMPEVTAETEAILIAFAIREAFWIATASPDFSCDIPFEERFESALTLINKFSKGLTW